MSNWQYKLDLTDVWSKYPDEISVVELGKTVAERLEKLKVKLETSKWSKYAEYFEDLVDDFHWLEEDVDEFDGLMDKLYDLGDIALDENWNGKKLIWIATNF